VKALDGAGNASTQATATGTTAACAPAAPAPTGGFPDSSNTGVPGGTALTAYTGSSTISTPNTVIVGKTMGCIRVTAPGVVIRNSRISCNNGYAVSVDDKLSSSTLLTIEDSEIDCGNSNATAIGDADVTARRMNIHGCENGLDVNQNITLEDSYIHDLYNGGGAHMDGVQLSFGHWNGSSYPCCALNVTIRHNTIYAVDSGGSLGTSAIISNQSGDANILITNNLLAGGAYTLYCEQAAKGTNYQVMNNSFSRKFSSKVGAYGPSTGCSDETQSGNVYLETGLGLSLG
jgi:hypothetical protein